MNYGARWGLATNPKRLKSSGIKRLLERALWELGIRQPLKEGTKHHEWKAAHGMRKYYKSHAEQVVKPINVEITMGHDIGISAAYYKPKVQEVLQDYLKAVPLLSINAYNIVLQYTGRTYGLFGRLSLSRLSGFSQSKLRSELLLGCEVLLISSPT